jgi:hypothetical protein
VSYLSAKGRLVAGSNRSDGSESTFSFRVAVDC